MSWQRLNPPSERYTSLAVRADSRLLIGGATGGWVRWWSLADGTPLPLTLAQGQPLTCLAFAPDGQQVAGGLADGTVALWQVGTRAPQQILGTPGDPPLTGLAWAPDGGRLAAWDATRLRLWSGLPGPLRATVPLDGVDAAIWSPDGVWLVTVAADTVALWRGRDGTLVRQVSVLVATAAAVVFHPQQSQLLLGTVAGQVLSWALPDGPLHPFAVNLAGAVQGLAVTGEPGLLAVVDASGRVLLSGLDGAGGQRAPTGYDHALTLAAFPEGGRALVTLAANGTVLTWRMTEVGGLALRRWWGPIPAAPPLRQTLVAPNGRALAAVTEAGGVWVWRLPRRPRPLP